MGLRNVQKFDCDIELVIDGDLKEKALQPKFSVHKKIPPIVFW